MVTSFRATLQRIVLFAAMVCLCGISAQGAEFPTMGEIGTFEALLEPVQVGTEIVELIETNHPYFGGVSSGELQLIWSEEIHSPGASYICPHFSRFELAEGDYVVVRSPDKERSWSYEGTGKGDLGLTDGFWAIHIPGESAVIELYSRNVEGAYGFTIDRYAQGFPTEESKMQPPNIEAICGTDDSDWAKCYSSSEATIYDNSRAVIRLLINGSSGCTGWLVGSEGHVLTNNHCIEDQSDASNTNFEFMAEGSTCATNCASAGACAGTIEATSSTLVQTSADIDYSLVLLPSNESSTYGYFQLRKDGGISDERIYIPQHPQYWGKKIAVDSTNSNDESGYAELYGRGWNGSAFVWLYFADTQGGSSGAPVVAYDDHMVVALHHAEYDCDTVGNGGPEIEEVITDLDSNLPDDAIINALDVTVSGSGTGTVTSSPSGIDCPGDCSEDFGNNTVIDLTPSAGANSVFSGWSGDADCSDGQVTLDDDISCTATFDLETHTLTMATTGAGGGTVTSSPTGISCPGDCSEDYDYGEVVDLTATPDGSSEFSGWSGDTDCSDGQVTLDADVSCTATFIVATRTLSVTVDGSGTGTVSSSPSGISCPGDCGEGYDHGEVVTLTPSAGANSEFSGWSGDADCSDGEVTMDADISCTATFNLETHTVTVTTTGTGSGTVTSSPTGISCPGDCGEDYDYGEVVDLTATPDGSSEFSGWTGDADCSDGQVTVTGAVSCTATFTLATRTLSVTVDGGGTGSVSSSPSGISCPGDCSEGYDHGEVVTLTPSAGSGSEFAGWSGDADCSDGEVTMDANISCTATFEIETFTLTVSSTGSGTGTVSSSPSGISCPGDCSEDYEYDQVVTLTPSAGANSVFAGWSGDADCSDGEVTMNGDVSCTAAFNLETYTLTVATTGSGTGTVSSSPTGISCPGDCSEDYEYGQTVTLTPTAGANSVFSGWSGDADCSDGQVTVNSAVSCNATFGLVTRTLTVTVDGTGSGTVSSSPAGIACPGDCSEGYVHGQVVDLAPSSDSGSYFVGFSGDSDCSDGQVTMDADFSCTATFDINLSVTYFVDVDATGGVGTGDSWPDAFTNLQDALAVAVSTDHIWVAEGVYYPDVGTGQTPDDVASTFRLINGVAIYGGFDGSEDALGDRDWVANVTILSGDIDGDDTNDDGDFIAETWDDIQGNNAYHLVTADGPDSSTVLDGLTMTAGYAAGAANTDKRGAALLCSASGSPSLNNLTVIGNRTDDRAAMYNCTPTVNSSLFESNYAQGVGAVSTNGGTFVNTVFLTNRAVGQGSAFYAYGETLTMTNCAVIGGQSTNTTGAVRLQNGTIDFDNVLFSGNKAKDGAAVNLLGSTGGTLTNVTFTANRATQYGGGLRFASSGDLIVENSIFWNNQDGSGAGTLDSALYNDGSGTVTVSSSILQGSGGSTDWIPTTIVDGGNNLDEDPTFAIPVDPATAPTSAGDCHLLAGSWALDSGDNSVVTTSVDLDGDVRIQDGTVDMGPYEGAPEQADLAITKTDGVTSATPGQGITYTIVVSNNGPADATSVSVTDAFPAVLLCAWTSISAGGTTGNGSGSGDIDETLGMPSGSSVTYEATCVIASGATGTLANTATISSAVSDPDNGNNSATDDDTVLAPEADLSITKDDGSCQVDAGSVLIYTIQVDNVGPSDAVGAQIDDTFPAELTSCEWTCQAAGGASCTAGPVSGDISDVANLPVSSMVTYTATCTVSSGASFDQMTNTATVTEPAGTVDPDGSNNSDTATTAGPLAIFVDCFESGDTSAWSSAAGG
ncbi:MAG: DUF11 domain-containing protein [bacterium]|nr:DUF11 domain-containing protein [bacterium]